AWSISIEWQFYLIAPLVVFLARRSYPGIAGAAAIGLALLFVSRHGPLASNSAFVGRGALWFAIGISSYFAWTKRGARRVRLVVAAGSLVLFAYGLWRPEPGAVVWALVLPTLCGMLGPVGAMLARFLCWGPIKQLGDISYSTYMVHMAVLAAVMWVAG